MTPAEKARELILKYYNKIEHTLSIEYEQFDLDLTKDFALIAVDEILFALKYDMNEPTSGSIKYWREVKQEIEKL